MSDSCCGKPIDAQALQGEQRRVLRIVMAINIATFVLMIAAAMYSRSSALLSGALDNFGDALTYALSLAVGCASTLAKSKVAMFKAALILLALRRRNSMEFEPLSPDEEPALTDIVGDGDIRRDADAI